MVQIALGLGLAGKAFLPVPLFEQLRRERVGVGIAFRVETGTGIAVPVPGAADAAAGLEYKRIQPELAQLVELVQPGNAGANDDRVIIQSVLGLDVTCCRLWHSHPWFS